LPELGLPPGSVSPRYGSYCISGIPSTITKLFDVQPVARVLPPDALGDADGVQNVVLLVLDGFGMSEWRRQQSEGFIKTMTSRGSVRPITTVFPSTTAAALTTFATGQTPQEHGLLEWFLYLKEVDAVVATLPFSFARDSGRETLRGRMNPRALFRGEAIFGRLKQAGVDTQSFVSRALVDTSYTSLVHRSSDKVAYSSASDMVAILRRNIESARRPTFFYIYWSYVDSIEHRYGPATEESGLEASSISYLLQKGLIDRVARQAAKKTLLIVSADHGQVKVSPEKTIYLNRYRSLVNGLRRTRTGEPIGATGSARDVFLHVQEDKVERVAAQVAEALGDRASVFLMRDAVKRGLFGLNKPCRKFNERAGDLLILPHGNGTVWQRDRPDYELELRGHHGGLSVNEMTVPLAVGRLSKLQR